MWPAIRMVYVAASRQVSGAAAFIVGMSVGLPEASDPSPKGELFGETGLCDAIRPRIRPFANGAGARRHVG